MSRLAIVHTRQVASLFTRSSQRNHGFARAAHFRSHGGRGGSGPGPSASPAYTSCVPPSFSRLCLGACTGATLLFLAQQDTFGFQTAHAAAAAAPPPHPDFAAYGDLGAIETPPVQEEKVVDQSTGRASSTSNAVDLNPGKWDDMSRSCKEVLSQENFDGFLLDVSQPIVATKQKQFNITHSVLLGSQQAPEGSYEFGALVALPPEVRLTSWSTDG